MKEKEIVKNKKASFDYIFLEKIEAGIILNGDEVKSILNHNVNFANSYVKMLNSGPELINCHIGYYKFAKFKTRDETERYTYRSRKLLLNKKQIAKLSLRIKRDRVTIIPIKFHINERGKIKLEIAVARGKKLFDKRQSVKERDFLRENSRNLKHN